MKKVFAVAILLAIATNAFSQHADSLRSVARTEYLRKSKNQKTAAWVLLGGGVAMFITGSIIYNDAYNKAAEQDPLGTLLSYGTNVNPTGGYIALAGTLAALGSIPLFIASGKNKKRAMAISTGFKLEKASVLQGTAMIRKSYPALSLKIGL